MEIYAIGRVRRWIIYTDLILDWQTHFNQIQTFKPFRHKRLQNGFCVFVFLIESKNGKYFGRLLMDLIDGWDESGLLTFMLRNLALVIGRKARKLRTIVELGLGLAL